MFLSDSDEWPGIVGLRDSTMSGDRLSFPDLPMGLTARPSLLRPDERFSTGGGGVLESRVEAALLRPSGRRDGVSTASRDLLM